MSILSVSGLTKTYQIGTDTIRVLRDLDLQVEEGEMVAVIGASGVGKSTLLHVLGGLDPVDAGSILVDDIDWHGSTMPGASRSGTGGSVVFQFHHLLPEFTALENAEMPMRIARRPVADGGDRRGCFGESGWRAHAAPPRPVVGWRAAVGGVARALVMTRACSPTSRPATSTSRRPTRSTTCCATCMPRPG
jgi:lipoprotein-releasing system ATP-binding protein